MDMMESPRDKAHRRVTSKADPNKAMAEAQPGKSTATRFPCEDIQAGQVLTMGSLLVMQALEKSTIESLRSMQHRDIQGNIISTFVEAAIVRGLTDIIPSRPR